MRAMPTVFSVVLRSLKKALLSRVELRIVTITVLLSLAAMGFGAFMKDGAERSTPRGGALGRVAFRIGSMPQNLFLRFFRAPAPPRISGVARKQRFHGRDGLSLPPPPGRGIRGIERKDREADIWSLRAASLSRRRTSLALNRRRVFKQ